jgi:DNA repair exonuclease SbcCD ATPase subunit
MKIKKIKLINFKNFQEETEFSFKDENFISGKNGSGKTAIKDAILFCFYNRTSDGSLSESSRHISNNKNKCLVEITFEKNGEEIVIRRERTEKQTRITYCDNSQSEEDSQITQESLESIIPKYEDFQAVFNIGWFMSLPDREKRNYILNLTPQINKSEIFEKLGGTHEDIEKFGLFFNDTKETYEQLLKRKRENTANIESMRIFIKETASIEIPKLTLENKSKELEKLKKEKEDLVHIQYSWKKYNEILTHNIGVEDNNKILLKRISEIKIAEMPMPNQDEINLLTVKKNEYSKQISLPIGTCPTCLQDVSFEHRDKIEKINVENKSHFSKIESEIDLKKNEYKNKLEYWQINEDNKKKKLMLESQFLDPLPTPEKPVALYEIDENRLSKLEKEQEDYLNLLNTIKVLTEQEDFRLKKLEKYKEKMLYLSQENERLLFLINIFSPKGIPAEEMNIKLEPLKKIFQTLLPNSDIVTLDLLKNEMGYREVFKITIDGKDYAKLSLGEKIRVDISLSQIINSMLKEKIDMFFLDNSEVVDKKMNLPAQSFICKVTNQPLKIN